MDFVKDFSRAYPQQIKRLIRFFLSLPIHEHEIDDVGTFSSGCNKGVVKDDSSQIADFKFDYNYLSEVEDDEVVTTIQEIFRETTNKQIAIV